MNSSIPSSMLSTTSRTCLLGLHQVLGRAGRNSGATQWLLSLGVDNDSRKTEP